MRLFSSHQQNPRHPGPASDQYFQIREKIEAVFARDTAQEEVHDASSASSRGVFLSYCGVPFADSPEEAEIRVQSTNPYWEALKQDAVNSETTEEGDVFSSVTNAADSVREERWGFEKFGDADDSNTNSEGGEGDLGVQTKMERHIRSVLRERQPCVGPVVNFAEIIEHANSKEEATKLLSGMTKRLANGLVTEILVAFLNRKWLTPVDDGYDDKRTGKDIAFPELSGSGTQHARTSEV